MQVVYKNNLYIYYFLAYLPKIHYLCSIFLTQNYTTMQTTIFLPLSPTIKSVTIIASIIILATMGYMAYQWYTTKQVMLLVTFVIVAIANKLIRQAFAVVNNNQPYIDGYVSTFA